jgi:hypothetical protein
MPDLIPGEAVQAAMQHVTSQPLLWQYVDEQDVRAILEAAAQILATCERRKIADGFRTLAAKCRAIPDEGLTMGERWQRDEQARDYDRIADMIERRTDA